MIDLGVYCCYQCMRSFTGKPWKSCELGRNFCSETCYSILTGIQEENKEVILFDDEIKENRERILDQLIKTYPKEENWKMQADLWMRVYNSKIPTRHEVTGFGIPPVGSIYMDQNGRLHTRQEGTYYPGMCPILRKLKPEPITEDTIITMELEYRKYGVDWRDDWSNLNIGSTIGNVFERNPDWCGAAVRYKGYPNTEMKIGPDIKWETPTDIDARHRPEVFIKNIAGTIVLSSPYVLMYVVNGEFGIQDAKTGKMTTCDHCHMDPKQRENWE